MDTNTLVSGRLPERLEWHGLPAEYFRDDALFQAELSRIWRSAWLFACAECELPQHGSYMTLDVGDALVLVVRDEDGIRAFHNLCTHRGTILCTEPQGKMGKLLICPYHQWSFTRSGALNACRGMHDIDKSTLGLRPVATTTVAGMVFICLADESPDTTALRRTFSSAEPQGFARSKVAKAIDYRVAANWKIVWENNRECYHCDAGHPQYVKANFDIAEAERDTAESRAAQAAIMERAEAYWSVEGLSTKHEGGGLARFPDPRDTNPFPVSATRTVMVDGYESESMDGRLVAPLMGALKSPDVGVLRLRAVPNFWCHASCDHAVITRLLPVSRTETAARVIWLVDESAREGTDYDLEKLLPFWQLTSEQDWDLCEKAARGMTSPTYRPGPLSRLREYNLEAFFTWYGERIGAAPNYGDPRSTPPNLH